MNISFCLDHHTNQTLYNSQADYLKNLSVCDASMKFGKEHPWILFYQKSNLKSRNGFHFSRCRIYGIHILEKLKVQLQTALLAHKNYHK